MFDTEAVPRTDRARIAEPIRSVAEILTDLLPAHGDRPGVRYDDGATYRTLAFTDILRNVSRALAVIGPSERQKVVSTFVENRPEWDMMALASLYSGSILFPLDTDMNDSELDHLLAQSPPDLVLVSAASRSRMREALDRVGLTPRVVIADLYPTFEDAEATVGSLGEQEERLSDAPRPLHEALPAASDRLADRDLVLGHYATSGTTGLPKVVRITHGNIVAQINEGRDVMKLRPNEDVLNIGAYTHIATLLEFLVTKANGYCVTYVTRDVDEGNVLEDEIRKLKALGVRVKALMAVPKFWIFLMKEILEEMKDKAIWRGLYEHLTRIEQHAHLVDLGTIDKAKLNAVRLYLRNRMGGYFTYGISSSTRIDPGVIEIFAKLGVTVIDIYGATEASGIIARNRLNQSRRGSCGRIIGILEHKVLEPRCIPGIEHPVGELLLRGPTLSRGYVGRPEKDHLDADGWYHTGDLAWVDDEGWVFLVGREKELIHWADGTLIDRMVMSNLMVRSIWVKDALVTRLDSDDTLSVFVLPDRARLEKDEAFQQAVNNGVSPEAALRARLLDAIAHAESLADITPRLATDRIYLLDRKLERTPTHKIKFARELGRLDLSRFV